MTPPQKNTIDLPRSHHVMNNVVMNSRRFCRIGTVSAHAMLVQHPRMIAMTGSVRKRRLPNMIQSSSPEPHANSMNPLWKYKGNRRIESSMFQMPPVPMAGPFVAQIRENAGAANVIDRDAPHTAFPATSRAMRIHEV